MPTDLQFRSTLGPEPRKSIGDAVADLERMFPNVTQSSLRFLERRGFIAPTRTAGGHRTYTQNDIDRVRQIKMWQNQRISLRDIRQRLDRRAMLPSSNVLAERFIELALTGDVSTAQRTIIDAASAGVPVSELFGELLAPALEEIGRLWKSGNLLVAQEKEMTEVARELISVLTIQPDPIDRPYGQLVAACVEGERHDLGLRMICGLLRSRGFAVHFLGTDVAPEFIRDATRLRRPAAVLLSATLEARINGVRRTVEHLLAETGVATSPPILVGGQMADTATAEIRSWGAIPMIDRSLVETIDEIVGMIVKAAEPTVARTSL